MADGLFGGGGAYFGNPNIARQGIRARELAQQRDVNTLPDPKTFGFVSGLLGTAPDQLGMSVLNPNAQVAKDAAYYGYQTGNALQIAPVVAGIARGVAPYLPSLRKVAATVEDFNKATAFRKAQEANTFSLDKPGVSFQYGFGRRMGYPQERGTEPSKLFSNYADNLKSDKAKDEFREKMLNRASNFHSSFTKGPKETADFNLMGYQAVLETYPNTGATKVLIKDENKIVAAANLDKGMIDSIAVSKEYSGKGIGKELLNFIDESNIGNIYEVPDRSPGFVKIQKELIQNKNQILPTISPFYNDPFYDTIR
jgi:ribosomal protein S18 acetylase RimI-like enzyme